MSLSQFKQATSGDATMRRAWIQEVCYDILVPFQLLDWTAQKLAGYTTDNPVRNAK
jgi:hypothetical protein